MFSLVIDRLIFSLALCTLATVSFLNGARNPTFSLIAAGIFIVLFFIWLLCNKRQLTTNTVIRQYWLIWIMWVLFLLVVFFQAKNWLNLSSKDPYKTWVEFYLYVGYGAGFALFAFTLRSQFRMYWLVCVIVMVAFVQVVFGMINYYSGTAVFGWVPTHYAFIRVTGFHVNRNFFANLIAMSASFPIAWLMVQQKLRSKSTAKEINPLNEMVLKFCVALLLLPLLAGIILSGSRAAMLSLLLGMSGFAILIGIDKRLQFSLKGIMLTMMLAVGLFGAGVMRHRIFNLTSDSLDRIQQWKLTLSMIMQDPFFGKGAGAYETMFQNRTAGGLPPLTYDHAHSDYLELLSEVGIIGSIPLFVIIGMIFSKSIAKLLASRSLVRKRFILSSVLAISVILLHAMVDFPFQVPANVWVVLALLGVLMNASVVNFRSGIAVK